MSAGGPLVPRRRLGSELRRLREQAGRTIDQAATVLECSTSKMSRLETGKGVPRSRDIRDLLDLYGVSDESTRARLLDWATEGKAEGWWNSYRDAFPGEHLPDHLQRFLDLEAASSEILSFEPEVIPGLLQTEEYVSEIAQLVEPAMSAQEMRRFVEFRIERQNVYWTKAEPAIFRVVIGELALLRALVPPDVLRRQLAALEAVVQARPHRLDLRVLPFLSGHKEAVGGPFLVLKFDREHDQDVVHLEGREGATYLENPSDVQRYERVFGALYSAALPPSDSLARLGKLSDAGGVRST